jgi:hypothetical protein
MSGRQETVTLDDRALASNPGALDVQPLAFACSFPRWPLLFSAAAIAGAAAAVLLHWAFWAIALVLLAAAFFLWLRVEEHFLHGCVNPAVVVSTKPYRVAVYTDLTKGWKPCPAIKVLDQPLARMTGRPPREGDRLATVALYQRGAAPDHWVDFHPIVIDCVTRSRRDIARVFRSLSEEDWRLVEEGLQQVESPSRRGLYPLDPALLAPRDETGSASGTAAEEPAGRPAAGLRLVLPSAPLVPWIALLVFCTEQVVIDRSLPAGLLLLAAAFVLALYADCDTQERLGQSGWRRHSLPMRAGYWLLQWSGSLGTVAGAAAVGAALARSLKHGTLALGVAGILLALFGQSIWYQRLDRPRRAVVDQEARRYRRLVMVLLAVVFAIGIVVAARRRQQRHSDALPERIARLQPKQ